LFDGHSGGHRLLRADHEERGWHSEEVFGHLAGAICQGPPNGGKTMGISLENGENHRKTIGKG